MKSFRTKETTKIESALKEGFSLYVVGGAVRDTILGEDPSDIDLVTDATPSEMMACFEKHGVRCVPTGISHGTLTVVFENTTFEITTMRSDIKTDGRHALVEYVKDIRIDAERRDFTFNALYSTLEGEVFDFFNGIEDLKNNRVRFIKDPDKRIKEDYLRILRFFRFNAKFGGIIDAEILDAISNNSEELFNISGERIWKEISKMLPMKNAYKQIKPMMKTSVLKHIDLDIKPDTDKILKELADKGHSFSPASLLGFIVSSPQVVKDLFDCWRFPRYIYKHARFIAKNAHCVDQSLKTYTNMVASGNQTVEAVSELIHLLGRNEDISVDFLKSIPEFPVKGRDLISAGLASGPEIGNYLKEMKKHWMENGCQLSKEEIMDGFVLENKNGFS